MRVTCDVFVAKYKKYAQHRMPYYILTGRSSAHFVTHFFLSTLELNYVVYKNCKAKKLTSKMDKENPQNLNLKENPQKLKLKKLFVIFLLHNTFTFLGALLFIYLEECRPEQVPKPSKSKELQQFQIFIKYEMNLTFNEKYIILNKTNALLIGERNLDCDINELNLSKWWKFTIVTVYTIGK